MPTYGISLTIMQAQEGVSYKRRARRQWRDRSEVLGSGTLDGTNTGRPF